jgi:hypothetical protein
MPLQRQEGEMNSRVFVAACALTLAPCIIQADPPPKQAQIDFAMEVKDTLRDRLMALLLNEFENTTPENFAAGNEAISLVFDDHNRSFRLVGDVEPLRDNDRPNDVWEKDALEAAKKGLGFGPDVRKVNGKYFVRESIPLANFDPSCSICHQNYGPVDPKQYVGALMLRVPVHSGTSRQ